jgi:hypothetical protein
MIKISKALLTGILVFGFALMGWSSLQARTTIDFSKKINQKAPSSRSPFDSPSGDGLSMRSLGF